MSRTRSVTAAASSTRTVTVTTARALAGTGRPSLAEMLGRHTTTPTAAAQPGAIEGEADEVATPATMPRVTFLAQALLAHLLDQGSNAGGHWVASATLPALAALLGISREHARGAAAELANRATVTLDTTGPEIVVSVRRRSEPLIALPPRYDGREQAARRARERRLIVVPAWWPKSTPWLTRSAIGRLTRLELTDAAITEALEATAASIRTSRNPIGLLDKNLRRAATLASA